MLIARGEMSVLFPIACPDPLSISPWPGVCGIMETEDSNRLYPGIGKESKSLHLPRLDRAKRHVLKLLNPYTSCAQSHFIRTKLLLSYGSVSDTDIRKRRLAVPLVLATKTLGNIVVAVRLLPRLVARVIACSISGSAQHQRYIGRETTYPQRFCTLAKHHRYPYPAPP